MASAKYATLNYWEERFTTEDSYEWLCSFDVLAPLVAPFLRATPHPRVLVLGNGTSALPLELAAAHPAATVVATDFSPLAVAKMRAAFVHSPAVTAALADMLDLARAPGLAAEAPFDVVIDKGALDALLADGGDAWAPARAPLAASRAVCEGVAARLAPGGAFLMVSFAQPAMRLKHLLQPRGGAAGAGAEEAPAPRAAAGPTRGGADDDEFEPDLTPHPPSATPDLSCAGTLWATAAVHRVDAGLGYNLFALTTAPLTPA
jgi:SAM-dependent methyltransferase